MLLDYKLYKDKLCAVVSIKKYCKLLLIEQLLELGHLGKISNHNIFWKQKILKFITFFCFFLQTDQLYLFYWLLVVPLAIFIAGPVVFSRT